ncbi:hypothetical protein AB7M33_003262 [Pseudomonas sp. Y3 TE3536]
MPPQNQRQWADQPRQRYRATVVATVQGDGQRQNADNQRSRRHAQTLDGGHQENEIDQVADDGQA